MTASRCVTLRAHPADARARPRADLSGEKKGGSNCRQASCLSPVSRLGHGRSLDDGACCTCAAPAPRTSPAPITCDRVTLPNTLFLFNLMLCMPVCGLDAVAVT